MFDVTVPISNNLVTWPGDPPVEVTVKLDVANGDPATVRHLSLGSHTGTHVDVPCHFIAGAATLDDVPLSHWLGPCRVVSLEQTDAIDVPALKALDWTGVERVLFKTRNSHSPWWQQPFAPGFVHLLPEAAQFLVDQGVRLVGIDYLSLRNKCVLSR